MPLQVTHNKNINWGGQLLKVWIKCEEVYQCVAIKFYGVTYCEFGKLFLFVNANEILLLTPRAMK